MVRYNQYVQYGLRYAKRHPNKYVRYGAAGLAAGLAGYEQLYTPSSGGSQKQIKPQGGSARTRGKSTLKGIPVGSGKRTDPFTDSNTTKMRRLRFGGRSAHPGVLRGMVRRPRKSVRRTTQYKMRKGVAFTYEMGKVLNTGEVQYIGHITHPQALFLKNMWAALLKALFIKAGIVFRDLGQTLPTLSTDSIIIRYQKNVLGSVLSVPYIPGVGANIVNMADYFIASGPWYAAGNTSEWQDSAFVSIEFKPVSFNPDINSASLDMSNMRLKYDIKSALKLQNRTTNVPDDNEADDVDNVPLYGKVYAGSGTGARISSSNNASFFYGDNTTGLITNNGASQNDIAEPPPPHMFPEVKKWSKMSLSPGEIKTSVLSVRSSSKWNDIHNRIMLFSNSVTAVKRHIGKFRFFALEKVIDAQVLTEGINIALEHQITLNTEVSTWVSQDTAVWFDKRYL